MSSDSDRRTFSGPEVRIDTQNIKTGVDAIRAKTWSVWRRGNFAGLARDVQYPIGDLEGWVTGQKPQPPDAVMSALAKTLFHNARWNSETCMLEDTRPPPTVVAPCGAPQPWVNPDPDVASALAALRSHAAQPPKAVDLGTGDRIAHRFVVRLRTSGNCSRGTFTHSG